MKTSQQLVAEAKARISEATVATVSELTDANALVIDIREPAEYADGHIADAVNVPRGVLEFQIASHPAVVAAGCAPEVALEQLAERPIYLICRSGGRSALAAESLQNMGLKQVYSVAGGMNAWNESNYPTVK